MTTLSTPPQPLRTISRPVLRPILGFVIAPALPALILLAIQTINNLARPHDPSITDNRPLIVLGVAILGYALAIIVNLPLFILFRRRGWNGLWTYLASGTLQGLLVYPAYKLTVSHIPSWELAPKLIPFGTLCGIAVALCFWLIVRPDRAVRRTEAAAPLA
jgi:hypothetical protein